MPFIRYSTFTVHATNDDCSGTWAACNVIYGAAFLIVQTKNSGKVENIVIPAHWVIVANGVEAA